MPPEPPVRRSKLANDDPLGDNGGPAGGGPTAATSPRLPPPAPAVPATRRPATRSRRRRASPLPDLAMVSFNAKMTVIARRTLKELAARLDVDIQDLVEDAIIELLAGHGLQVPRRPEVEQQERGR